MKPIEMKGTDFCPLSRVEYAKELTPLENREYRLSGVIGCPVGCIKEWTTFAKKHGFKGLRLHDKEEVTFVFFDEVKLK